MYLAPVRGWVVGTLCDIFYLVISRSMLPQVCLCPSTNCPSRRRPVHTLPLMRCNSWSHVTRRALSSQKSGRPTTR